MHEYRVTKYDPALRDEHGAFVPDVWTSVSDIECELVTPAAYLETEEAYVRAIRRIVAPSSTSAFTVTALELFDEGGDALPPRTQELAVLDPPLQEGDQVSGMRLDATIRANLRDKIWCRLEHSDGRFIRFGQDLYVYVRVREPLDGVEVPKCIYVEECECPVGR